MTLTLAIINGLVVISGGFLRIRQKPFLVLDFSWALMAGFFVNYCLRPIFLQLSPVIFSVYPSYGISTDDATSETALLLALLFILAFVTVDLLRGEARRRPGRARGYKFADIIGSSSFTTAAWVLVCLGPLGMVGYLVATDWEGSVWELLTGAARYHILGRHAGLGYYMLAMYLGLIGWLALCVKWEVSARVSRKTIGTRVVRSIPLLVNVGVFTVFGERQGVIITILTPMFVSLMRLRPGATSLNKRGVVRRVLAYSVLAVTIAGPVGMVLKQHDTWRVSEAAALAISPWDSYELTLLAVDRFKPDDLLYGRSYAEDVVYTYLPRVFFPGKPFRYGIYSIQDRICPELQQLSGSFPPGILVEAYVNAGFAYLIIPITLALVFAWVYDRLSERNLYWIAQATILFPVLLIFRSLGSVLSQFVLNAVLLFVLAGLTRLFDLRQRARARDCAPQSLVHHGPALSGGNQG